MGVEVSGKGCDECKRELEGALVVYYQHNTAKFNRKHHNPKRLKAKATRTANAATASAAQCSYKGLKAMSLSRLEGLQVVQETLQGGGTAEAVILDGSKGALDDLAGLALLVDLAKAAPLAELSAGRDLNELHILVLAHGNDNLLDAGLIAVAGQKGNASITVLDHLKAPV